MNITTKELQDVDSTYQDAIFGLLQSEALEAAQEWAEASGNEEGESAIVADLTAEYGVARTIEILREALNPTASCERCGETATVYDDDARDFCDDCDADRCEDCGNVLDYGEAFGGQCYTCGVLEHEAEAEEAAKAEWVALVARINKRIPGFVMSLEEGMGGPFNEFYIYTATIDMRAWSKWKNANTTMGGEEGYWTPQHYDDALLDIRELSSNRDYLAIDYGNDYMSDEEVEAYHVAWGAPAPFFD